MLKLFKRDSTNRIAVIRYWVQSRFHSLNKHFKVEALLKYLPII